MSDEKTPEESTEATAEELSEDQLDEVSGGIIVQSPATKGIWVQDSGIESTLDSSSLTTNISKTSPS